jgi:ribonuclease P protein component
MAITASGGSMQPVHQSEAVLVSRKVSKSAVVRNRIRRRLYEHVRILSTSFSTPHDLALLVYDERIATMDSNKLAAEVIKLCKKAGLTSHSEADHAIVKH